MWRPCSRSLCSDDPLVPHAAAVHLVFQLDDWRPGEMPSQAGPRRSAPNDLLGKKRIEIVDGIDLGRGGVMPAKAERRKPPLHLGEHEPGLLAQAFRAD